MPAQLISTMRLIRRCIADRLTSPGVRRIRMYLGFIFLEVFMGYGITAFKVKKLEDLKIPVSAFFERRSPFIPAKEYSESGKLTLLCGCEQRITGTVKNEILTVQQINMSGEGSGTFIYEILNDALKQSTGVLEAVCVWEGGDFINKLIVNNGFVSWEDIEL